MLTYQDFENRFLSNSIDNLSSHEALCLIDFQLRLTTFVGIASLRHLGGPPTPLPRAPGLGAWVAAIRGLRSSSEIQGSMPVLSQCLEDLHSRVQGAQPAPRSGGQTIKRYRDLLFHGVPEIGGADHDAADICRAVAKQNSESLGTLLADFELPPKVGQYGRVTVRLDGEMVDLWPFLVVDPEQHVCVFGNYGEGLAHFIALSGESSRRPVGAETVVADLTKMLTPSGKDGSFSNFVKAVKQDVLGFSLPNVDVLHVEDGRAFSIEWIRATTDADTERSDRFRIGPSEERQWWDPEGDCWRPYREFLKFASSWERLRRRLRDVLRTAESADSYWSDTTFVEPRFQERLRSGLTVPHLVRSKGDAREVVDATSLRSQLAETTDARGRNTEIVLVQGPAGIGKTKALRQLVRSGLDDPEGPLYLYVQAGGVSLRSLSDLVASVVNETRILTPETVRALARSGLLVLVIDGFDELVGGTGYSEPVEALRPWLESLEGRGVLVVSARSSYFFNHYLSSVRSAGLDLSVAHRVFEVLPWDEGQIVDYFSARSVTGFDLRRSVRREDRKLLGLPFFVRVVASEIESGKDLTDARVAELLVEAYLDREFSKLNDVDPKMTVLLEREELRGFFINVAALMDEELISPHQLEEAAEYALNHGTLEDRPGLAQRLTAACGLEVQDTGGRDGFKFQHELFFDYFVSHAVVEEIAASVPRAMGLAGINPLRPFAAELIVAQASTRVVKVLRETESERGHEHPIRRTSAGSLYAALLEQRSAELSRVVGAVATEMDCLPEQRIILEDVEVESLTVRSGSAQVVLSSVRVHDLTLESKSPQIEIRSSEVPVELTTTDALFTGQRPIVSELQRLGVSVPQEWSGPLTSSVAEDCEDFLERLNSGIIVQPVVQESDRLPNDQRLSWALERRDSWVVFVRTLEEQRLLELRSISAAGNVPMLRMKFAASPAELLERVSDRSRAFWLKIDSNG